MATDALKAILHQTQDDQRQAETEMLQIVNWYNGQVQQTGGNAVGPQRDVMEAAADAIDEALGTAQAPGPYRKGLGRLTNAEQEVSSWHGVTRMLRSIYKQLYKDLKRARDNFNYVKAIARAFRTKYREVYTFKFPPPGTPPPNQTLLPTNAPPGGGGGGTTPTSPNPPPSGGGGSRVPRLVNRVISDPPPSAVIGYVEPPGETGHAPTSGHGGGPQQTGDSGSGHASGGGVDNDGSGGVEQLGGGNVDHGGSGGGSTVDTPDKDGPLGVENSDPGGYDGGDYMPADILTPGDGGTSDVDASIQTQGDNSGGETDSEGGEGGSDGGDGGVDFGGGPSVNDTGTIDVNGTEGGDGTTTTSFGSGGDSPDPDSPDGGDESPRVTKGGGFHPHGGDVDGADMSSFFADPDDEAYGALQGYLPGVGGSGDDWGGTNPHYDADPDSSGSSPNMNASTGADPTDDDMSAPNIPTSGNEDDFWSGNNPHYMPYAGSSWTPYANVGIASRVQFATRTNVVSHVTIKKAGI